MIITCPYCGPRDSSEFIYRDEGGRTRPDQASTDQAAWNAYVYERVNTAGVTFARDHGKPHERRKAETPA